MSDENTSALVEDIYKALANNNEDVDLHITRLKNSFAASGNKQAVFDPARLAQNNRAGRKLMHPASESEAWRWCLYKPFRLIPQPS